MVSENSSGVPALVTGGDLAYTVNGIRILDRVSLTVRPGEFIGLIGPNGAGKTTLMKLLGGIIQPSSGEILLKGIPLKKLRQKEVARIVSYMAQEAGLGFGFPVIDVLLLGRYPYLKRFSLKRVKYRRGLKEDIGVARRMLSYVGLAGFDERPFAELSGGEKQLILFAKILVQETDLLLLDEPTANLDIKHQDQIFSMTAELTREKKAVIAAVHNLNVAAAYCNRLILLKDGQLVADGRPEQVLKPAILDQVYGVRTSTSVDTSLGTLTVSVFPRKSAGKGPRVHLIGGAGSAVNLTRELFRRGCCISGGITHAHDSDEKLWHNLGVETCVVPAFSWITDVEVEKARQMVEQADVTLLCSFPVGAANLANLKLAGLARKLIVVASGESEVSRSFFAQEAEELYVDLAKTARILSYEQVIAALSSL